MCQRPKGLCCSETLPASAESGCNSLLQHKRITEMHASLSLPLVTNANLAFLKHHLALSAPQRARINESLAANSARLGSFESALAKAEAQVQQ